MWDERIAELLPVPGQRWTDGAHRQPGDVKFMHCLPAFHDPRHRRSGAGDLEQTGLDGASRSPTRSSSPPASIVFDQAENRMHTIKAVMVATLAESTRETRRR